MHSRSARLIPTGLLLESGGTADGEMRVSRFRPTACRRWSVSLLEVRGEALRQRRAPAVEGVFHAPVLGAPGAVGGDLVDVAEIFGQAVPGIAQIVEEVGAQHMATEA